MNKHYKVHVTPSATGRARYTPEAVISELLMDKFADVERPVVIAIGGPGGIGKSSFSKRLQSCLPDSNILHLDNYKTSRKSRADKNVYGAHPEANCIDLIKNHLQAIHTNSPFETPVYDTVNGTVDTYELFIPKKIVLLDGEISTYADFYEWVDFSIFIDSDWKTQLKTRITRDIHVRKYTQEKAIATFLQSNLREFREFGVESKKWADIHLFCREDYSLIIESVDQELYQAFRELFEVAASEVDIKGIIVPVLTPFDDQHKIDELAFVKHLKFLEDNGIHRILIGSEAGETFSLLPEERKLLLLLAREYFPGVILLQVTGSLLEQALKDAEMGSEYGADAIVTRTPNIPNVSISQKQLTLYFDAIKKVAGPPLMIFDENRLYFYQKPNSYFSSEPISLFECCCKEQVGVVLDEANCLPDYYADLECCLEMTDDDELDELKKSTQKLHHFFKEAQEPIALLKYGVSLSVEGYPVNCRLPLSSEIENDRIEKMKLFM